ncbi:MAG: hypothetical protein KDA89_21245, partial [Planctomycetaceae bacterium]|nr:hypothetical protein [Planctomycetaceae bacterium]
SEIGNLNNEFNDVTVTAGELRLGSGGIHTVTNGTDTGEIQINADLVLTGSTTIDSAAGSITFNGAVDADDAANGHALTVDAGSEAIAFIGDIGGTESLGDLDLTGGSISLQSVNLGSSPTAHWVTDSLSIGGAVSTGGGTLTIAPQNTGTSIGIGTGATGTLSLDHIAINRIDNGFSLITIGDAVNGTGAVDIDASVFADSVSIFGGSISVNGLDVGTNDVTLSTLTGGITDGDSGTDITAANIILAAADGIGAADDIDVSADNVTFSAAAGAVQITEGNGATFSGVSNSNAGVTLRTSLGDLGVAAGGVVTSGGELTLRTGSADAAINIAAGTGISTTGSGSSGAAITLRADNMDLQANVTAGTGPVAVRTTGPSVQAIQIGSTLNDNPANLRLSDAELDQIITNGGLTIGSNNQDQNISVVGDSGPDHVTGGVTILTRSGNIDIDAVFSTGTDLTLQANSGSIDLGGGGQLEASGRTVTISTASGAILDDDTSVDIVAQSAELIAATGIGASDTLETQLTNLAFNNTAGLTNIHNTGALTIGAVGSTLTSHSGGGGVISAGSPLTVSVDVTMGGDFTLQAEGDIAGDDTDDDLTINANVTHTGAAGVAKSIKLLADDDVRLTGGAVTFQNANAGDVLTVSADDATVPDADTNAVGDFEFAGGSISLGLGTVNISTSTAVGGGAIINFSASGADIVAPTVNLTARSGIGSVSAVETSADVVTFLNTENAVRIAEADGMSVSGTNAGAGAVELLAVLGSLTVDSTGITTHGGTVSLETQDAAGSDVIVDGTVTTTGGGAVGDSVSVTSTGDVEIHSGAGVVSGAGDQIFLVANDMTVDSGATLSAAAGQVSITIDSGAADAGGNSLNYNGILISNTAAALTGGLEADDISFRPEAGSSGNVEISGLGGDDNYTVGFGSLGDTVTVVNNSGEGTDSLKLTGTTGDDVFTIDGTSTVLGSETVTYDGNLETVAVFGGIGADTFHVTPSANSNTTIAVDGEAPMASAGDILNVTVPTGALVTVSGVTSGGGSIGVSGHGGITFAGIEETVSLVGITDLVISGTAGVDVLEITATGADDGSFVLTSGGVVGPVFAFSDLTSLTFRGTDAADILRIHNPTGSVFAPSGGISFDGGDGADSLEILGGTAMQVEHRFTNNSDGFVFYDAGSTAAISYLNL